MSIVILENFYYPTATGDPKIGLRDSPEAPPLAGLKYLWYRIDINIFGPLAIRYIIYMNALNNLNVI
jgi:hypothetical protein